MRRVQIIGALCLAAVLCLASAVSAGAAPTDPFQFKSSFNGGGSIQNPERIFVSHDTGNLLVRQNGGIYQYDPEGNPVDFATLGSPVLPAPNGEPIEAVAVDNSGGPTQGNIYIATKGFWGGNGFGGELLWSYTADGSLIGGESHNIFQTLNEGIFQAIGVLPDGTLRIVYLELGPVKLATAIIDAEAHVLSPGKPFSLNTETATNGMDPHIFDELGNLYTHGINTVGKYPPSNGYAFEGETGLPFGNLAVDPSTKDLYSRVGTRILGVHFSEPLVPATPFELLGSLSGEGPIAFDGTGEKLYIAEGENRITVFERGPATAPFGVTQPEVDEITTSIASFRGQFSAGGATTSYRFEYGTTADYGSSTAARTAPFSYFPVHVGSMALGLQPDTTYHVRMVATNAVGTTYGPDRIFKTYAISNAGVNDTCPNALARKQTVAQRVPDCRAYELVSAPDTGGYDVESYLAPGQTPFPGFPMATDKLLYATHSGAVPGPWNATNKGPDPYVATRTAGGWVTQYEGLPANLGSSGSFSSVLGEADSSLSTLAFAGPNLCSPCFTGGGLQTGIPVRLPSGQLVQGMVGSLVVDPSAKPEGKVAKYFSGDGRKLLFASKYAFEPGANDNGSDLTIYARNLAAGTTEVVSTDPSGNALSGEGISELDVSSDGSRVVIGKKLGADLFGNELIHPYLHIAGRPGSIDLAPLASLGVLYAGMTADGSKVFFTSPDKLIGSDTDNSADLYEADVDSSGNLALKAITANNSDACAPIDCSAVPISGGGGVASSTGAIYFLSPESFGGQGTPNLPNLYLASPSGAISFVATLEPDNPLLLDSLQANAIRRAGDFLTTPSGNYAAFTSKLPLTGVDYFGFRNVFRYEASSGQLACPSCDTSGTTNTSLADNVELAPNGLSLLSDGRVFFTTRFPLILNDLNARKDVYEWTAGKQELISAGSGPFDSGLLSASADGTDVFFFTHDNLAPEEDHNGALMRVYDAREGGGFFKLPPSVPCQAADECHGASTPAPGPADIKSSGKTTQGNVIVCAKNRVKKRGKCVKKQSHAKKHRKHAKKRGGAKKRAAKTNGKRGGRNA
jgi:hypothetical protein